MTPIAPGTVCLLVAPNEAAGRCCTVLVGPLKILCFHPTNLVEPSGVKTDRYIIEAPWLIVPRGWACNVNRRELVPICPPISAPALLELQETTQSALVKP